MIVLMTGATGSVGRALSRTLRREGHSVLAAVRSIGRAKNALGPEIALVDIADDRAMRAAVERADAIVNLAGEGIATHRWTARRKQALVASRVTLTEQLVERVRAAEKPPSVFISASAIGFYPDAAERELDERAHAGSDFLADLSSRWEAAAMRAQSERTRVVCLRIGVVLDAESGALASILPLFRLGLGARLASGRQYFSFIHLDDLLGIISFALGQRSLRGAINATAPTPVTNAELTRELARLVNRPALFRVPAFALRLLMGERAALMLESRRVVPRALLRAGYTFRYPTLHAAIEELRTRLSESTRIERYRGPRGKEPRAATHVLTQVTLLDAPLAQVFPFFARAQNLAWITPPWMGFAIRGAAPQDISVGTIIEYDIKLGPLPLAWRTRIASFEPGVRFVDNQERGPYSLWWHEHSFEPHEGGTKMVDRVLLRLPFGLLGSMVAGGMVKGTLRRIFGYRAQAMAQRFGRLGDRAPLESASAAQ